MAQACQQQYQYITTTLYASVANVVTSWSLWLHAPRTDDDVITVAIDDARLFQLRPYAHNTIRKLNLEQSCVKYATYVPAYGYNNSTIIFKNGSPTSFDVSVTEFVQNISTRFHNDVTE